VKIEEAFMVISNPQWVSVLDRIASGEIGELRAVEGHFSYNNQDLNNIRNKPETGGGGLMDIGCYMIFFSRLMFGAEPKRVVSLVEEHPESQTDVLTSALLDFPSGHATFTCSTRITPFQRFQVIGTRGRIEIQIPVNAPNDHPCTILIDDGSDLLGKGIRTIEFEINDQYTIQGDLFSQAIRENRQPILPLEESIKNMSVIDAVFRSAKSGRWEVPMSDMRPNVR
jgi:predicted dehydrogenase